MNLSSQRQLVVVMGVAGSGKSTVASALSEATGWPYIEGDSYHPTANINKMAAGDALTNQDRKLWIDRIVQVVDDRAEPNVVLACSALNPTVREWLSAADNRICRWIWLTAAPQVLKSRMENRKGHFMPVSLLQSQLAALIPPDGAQAYDTSKSVSDVCKEIMADL